MKTNEKFYPAKERKNDFIIKDVYFQQLNGNHTITHRKTVLKGKKLLGIKTWDIPNPTYKTKEEWDKLICKCNSDLNLLRTISENVYE